MSGRNGFLGLIAFVACTGLIAELCIQERARLGNEDGYLEDGRDWRRRFQAFRGSDSVHVWGVMANFVLDIGRRQRMALLQRRDIPGQTRESRKLQSRRSRYQGTG